ncbi:hypothetical protein [Roseovarius confluentis]|uniref:hypothetical protein n=1 Tax=Roseovarius confluentis TaxID=1852027 RepID=UPI000CDE2FFB|nr:hypothetical protein [Roseovarius confluentis]
MLIETPDKEVLNQARMAEFNRVATSAQGKNWVEHLTKQTLAREAVHHPRKRARKQKDAAAFRGAIEAFAADLLLHYDNSDADGFMYRLLDRQELAATHVSATNFEQLVKLWCELGWLEKTVHIHARQDWDGQPTEEGYFRARRYRATTVFIDFAQSCQLTPSAVPDHFKIDISASDLVQVRQTNKRRKNFGGSGKKTRVRGRKLQEQVAIIECLNQAMQDHSYSLSERPVMRRLFNCADRDCFDFNLGGRFYCQSADNWMNKSPQERTEITIDGEPTVEIDVSASQLFILYALHGKTLDYSDDPYRVGGYAREIVKQVIVTMIGAGKPPVRWPKKFNTDYKAEHGRMPNDDFKLSAVVDAVLKKHPILNELQTDSLDWANLQFEEAECFLSAMLKLHENHGVPSLPVHDSLIVRRSDVAIATDLLARAYQERLGAKPRLVVAGVR